MDFEDEPYVRLYTRKTLTWKLIGWEGRAVQRAMLGEFDAAGIFAIRGDAAECIAAVTEMPLEVVKLGLARLVETETWVVTARAITWPSYEEAQNCRRSDRLRQRESRRARVALAVTDVTRRHGRSQAVTRGHSESHDVTLPSSLPSSHPPMRDRAREEVEPPSERKTVPAPPDETPIALTLDAPCTKPWRNGRHEVYEDAHGRRCVACGATAGHPPKEAPPAESRVQRIAPALEGVARTYSMPSEEPPKDYLDEATMRGVKPEQARSTWTHYYGAGLPERGVERLNEWLCQRAKERQEQTARLPAKASPVRAQGDPYVFAITAEHREFCVSRKLDWRWALERYRQGGEPDRMRSASEAERDFMRRLRCWAATGEFHASGQLPKRPKEVAA